MNHTASTTRLVLYLNFQKHLSKSITAADCRCVVALLTLRIYTKHDVFFSPLVPRRKNKKSCPPAVAVSSLANCMCTHILYIAVVIHRNVNSGQHPFPLDLGPQLGSRKKRRVSTAGRRAQGVDVVVIGSYYPLLSTDLLHMDRRPASGGSISSRRGAAWLGVMSYPSPRNLLQQRSTYRLRFRFLYCSSEIN